MSDIKNGVSSTMFVAGIVITILVSTVLSTIIATQFAVGLQGLGTPDFDSDWTPISQSESIWFEHNLDSNDNNLVFIYGRRWVDDMWKYHQYSFGWDRYNSNTERITTGMGWDTRMENELGVMRSYNDTAWEQVRVLIWRINE